MSLFSVKHLNHVNSVKSNTQSRYTNFASAMEIKQEPSCKEEFNDDLKKNICLFTPNTQHSNSNDIEPVSLRPLDIRVDNPDVASNNDVKVDVKLEPELAIDDNKMTVKVEQMTDQEIPPISEYDDKLDLKMITMTVSTTVSTSVVATEPASYPILERQVSSITLVSCTKCHLSFGDQSSYDEHVSKFHSSSKPKRKRMSVVQKTAANNIQRKVIKIFL